MYTSERVVASPGSGRHTTRGPWLFVIGVCTPSASARSASAPKGDSSDARRAYGCLDEGWCRQNEQERIGASRALSRVFRCHLGVHLPDRIRHYGPWGAGHDGGARRLRGLRNYAVGPRRSRRRTSCRCSRVRLVSMAGGWRRSARVPARALHSVRTDFAHGEHGLLLDVRVAFLLRCVWISRMVSVAAPARRPRARRAATHRRVAANTGLVRRPSRCSFHAVVGRLALDDVPPAASLGTRHRDDPTPSTPSGVR